MKKQFKKILIMKNYILFLSFLLIFTTCDTNQNKPIIEEIEQIILTLEQNALDSYSKGNPIDFSDNFAEDATYFDDIGAHMRLDSIKEIKSYFVSQDGKVPPHNYELVNPKVQVYDDIAILTLRYHSTSLDGEPAPPWKATSVYRLLDGKWQVVHANWSLVKEDLKSEKY